MNQQPSEPLSIFDFTLWHKGARVAQFHSLTLSIHPTLPGVTKIEFILEQGLLDKVFFEDKISFKEDEQDCNCELEFDIQFDSCQSSMSNLGESPRPGVYSIQGCKISKTQLGLMPGRRIAVVKFHGVGTDITFISNPTTSLI